MTQSDHIHTGVQRGINDPPPTLVGAGVGSFAAFYETNYDAVLRVAIALTGDRQAAEDIAGDVIVDAYRRWSKISTYEQPGAWARRAVANKASSFRRRRLNWSRLTNRHPFRTSEDPAPLRDEDLWREVATLPARQAQVIVLHYVEQFSTREIAELLNISQASAKTHLQRARHTLAARLQHDRARGDITASDITATGSSPAGGHQPDAYRPGGDDPLLRRSFSTPATHPDSSVRTTQ